MSMLLSLCIVNFRLFFFFFSSRRRHTRCSRDWSSDVCSSDLYQKAAGDWETNEKFPSGHRALTDRIHANGFKAGLWMAPFAVSQRSGVPAAHPDWLLRDTAAGPLAWDTREAWGGKLYALDGAHPKVQQWLTELARQVVRDWGYDCLEIDALHCATAGPAHYGGLTHAEAYRAGLAALRDGLGTEAFLLGGGAPLQHAAGLVNGMRIGPDANPTWAGVQAAVRAAALRSFYHRASWLNDPACLVVGPPLSASEARVWASVVAVSGGLTLFSDNLPKLLPERAALLQRVLPVAPVAGRPVGGTTLEHDLAPALVRGEAVYPIPGPWHFRTGDDAAYGTRAFDEEAWETITVPQRWDERSEEHTSELQSRLHLVCRLLLEKKKKESDSSTHLIRHHTSECILGLI